MIDIIIKHKLKQIIPFRLTSIFNTMFMNFQHDHCHQYLGGTCQAALLELRRLQQESRRWADLRGCHGTVVPLVKLCPIVILNVHVNMNMYVMWIYKYT